LTPGFGGERDDRQSAVGAKWSAGEEPVHRRGDDDALSGWMPLGSG